MPRKRRDLSNEVNQIIVFSDTHFGSRVGLYKPGVQLDQGMTVNPSAAQIKLYDHWCYMWDSWVPKVTKGEPFIVVANGDILEGSHHGSKDSITENAADQIKLALAVLEPVRDRCDGRLIITKGTEPHSGKSGENEELLAQLLNAIPNDEGQYTRYDAWIRLGAYLCHFMHHISTTGSMAYETTAVMKEMAEEYLEAARWSMEPPKVIVRSHRHRHIEVKIPSNGNDAIGFVTAGWQLKTPFAWKVAGARVSQPQFGLHLIRVQDGEIYTRHNTISLTRSPEVKF